MPNNPNTIRTYIVKYCTGGRVGGDRVTLTITGTEAQVVSYLRQHAEPAYNNPRNVTLGKYIAEVINMRDAEGGTALWGIYTQDGAEIREFVNGYEWDDEWEQLDDGEQFVSQTVKL
jgi:hypothetical protein